MGIELMKEVMLNAPGDLSVTEFRFLIALAESARDNTRKAWPGQKHLAECCKVSERQVRSVAKSLVNRKLIEESFHDSQKRPKHCNCYRIRPMPAAEELSSGLSTGSPCLTCGKPGQHVCKDCGEHVERRGSRGPWPKRCKECSTGKPELQQFRFPRPQTGTAMSSASNRNSRSSRKPEPYGVPPSPQNPHNPPPPAPPRPLWSASVPDLQEEGEGDQSPDWSESAVSELTGEVRTLRTEWLSVKIRKVLDNEQIRARPWNVVRLAMIKVASDPETQLPNRLLADGPWWADAGNQVRAVENRKRSSEQAADDQAARAAAEAEHNAADEAHQEEVAAKERARFAQLTAQFGPDGPYSADSAAKAWGCDKAMEARVYLGRMAEHGWLIRRENEWYPAPPPAAQAGHQATAEAYR